MPKLEQAPRYTGEDLTELLEKARSHSVYSEEYKNKTDYEVLLDLRRSTKYRGVPISLIQEKYLDSHTEKRNPRIKYSNYQYDPQDSLDKESKKGSIESFYDSLPKWLGDTFKAGWNESLSGMAAAVGTGGSSNFIMEDYDPNLFESGLSFAASMAYDIPFFAMTDGLGLFPKFAGKAAQNLAAQEISQIMFKKQLMSNVDNGLIALKKGTKELTGEALEKEAKKLASKETIQESSEALIRAGADKELIEQGVKAASLDARKYVTGQISNPYKDKFWQKGLTEYEGKKITNTISGVSLGKLFRNGAIRSGVNLGLYDVGRDWTQQVNQTIAETINPETGEPYGNDAPHIFERMKMGETLGDEFDWDPESTVRAGIGGLLGGMFAGGLNSVLAAGRAGALGSEKAFAKYMEDGHPRFMEAMYSKTVGLNAEALGFTGIHEIINSEALGGTAELDEDGKPVPFHEKFLHNLVNIGMLKGFHHYKDQWKTYSVKMKEQQNLDMTKRHLAELKILNETKDSIKGDSTTDKLAREGVNEKIIEAETKYAEEVSKNKDRFKLVDSLLLKTGLIDDSGKYKKGYKVINIEGKSVRVPKLTIKDLDQLEATIKEIVDVSETVQKDLGVEPSDISKRKQENPLFESLYDSVKNKKGLFAKLRKDIKLAESVAKVPSTPASLKAQAKELAAEHHSEKLSAKDTKKVIKNLDESQTKAYEAERKRLIDKDVKEKEVSEEKERLDLVNTIQNKGIEKIPAQKGNKLADKEGMVILKDATLPELKSRIKAIEEAHIKDLEREGRIEVDSAKREKEYDSKSPDGLEKIFGKDAKGVSQTIKNTKGTLQAVLKRIATLTFDGYGTSSIKPKFAMAKKFAKWMNKKGRSIEEATVQEMQNFLDANYKNPKGTGAYQNHAKFVMAAIKGGPVRDYKISHERTKADKNPLLPKEYDEAQGQLQATLKEDGSISVGSKKTISADVAHAINFIIAKIGSRSDFIFGGTKEVNKALRVKDIKEGESYGGKKSLILSFTGKTGKITWKVIDGKFGKEGINYYQVFKRLINGRKGTEVLLKTEQGKKFGKIEYNNFAKEFLLGEKEGATGHTLRNTLIGIGKAMDAAKIEIPKYISKVYGQTWEKIANRVFLTHKPEDMGERYVEYLEGRDPGDVFVNERMLILKEFWRHSEPVIRPETKADIKEREKFEKQMVKEMETEGKDEGGLKQKSSIQEVRAEIKDLENERAGIPNMYSGKYKIINDRIKALNKLEKQLENANREGRRQLYRTISKILVEEGLSTFEASKVVNFMSEMRKRNPGLLMHLTSEKQADWSGEFIRGLVKLNLHKMDSTTFFHENVHRLEEVVKATGNKTMSKMWDKGEGLIKDWAEKHPDRKVREEWKLFQKEYKGEKGTSPEKEFLTQISARWSAKRFNTNTRMGKLGNWIKEAVSYIKTYFGLGTPEDVARLFGKTAEVGFSSEGVKFDARRLKKVAVDRDSNATQRDLDELNKVQAEKSIDARTLPDILYRLMNFDKGELTVSDKGEILGAKKWQVDALLDFYETQLFNAETKQTSKKPKIWKELNNRAHQLQAIMGVTEKVSTQLKYALGIKKGTLANASERQIKSYIALLEAHGEKVPLQDTLFTQANMEKLGKEVTGWRREAINWINRGTLSYSMVLRKFGGSVGQKIARNFEDHYLLENRHVGVGLSHVSRAIREIGSKNTKYLPFLLDPQLMEPGKHNGKEIAPILPEGLDKFAENYRLGLADSKAGGKGTKESRAVQVIEQMTDYYWNTYKSYYREKIKNPRVLEEFERNTKRKYVEQYFSRTMTEEAKRHLNVGGEGYLKEVKKIMTELAGERGKVIQTDIEKLYKDLDEVPLRNNNIRNKIKKLISKKEEDLSIIHQNATNPKSELYKELQNNAAEILTSLLHKQNNNIENKYMLERLPKIDNVVVTDAGKKIQVWDTDFDKVMGQYMRTMSNYLATVKHFNEFTNVRGNFADGSGLPLDMLKIKGIDPAFSAFVEKGIKRRLGLEEVNLQTQVVTRVFTEAGRYSALFGLSSPFSSAKNLAIGTNMTIAIHGVMPFLHGVTKVFSIKNWDEARKRGWLELGTKELELNKKLEKVLGGGMKWTESINRIISGFAGEYNARQLADKIRTGGGLLTNWSEKMARKKLKSLFRLSESDIATISLFGLDGEGLGMMGPKTRIKIENQLSEIKARIGEYGHIRTQGATGDPFLPLWAGNRNVKALTLFYRMAYSGTANVFNHIVKPATQGDLLPMVRYGFSVNMTGSALWSMYEKVLGAAPPKKNESALANLGMNMAKTEALGLYSFMISPYAVPGEWRSRLLQDSIMQPAIIRNFDLLQTMMFDYIAGDVDMSKSINRNVGGLVVALGHGMKLAKNITNKYKTNYGKIRTYRNAWEKSTNRYEGELGNKPFHRRNANSEYYGLIKDEFYNNNLEHAANYYVTTWFYLYDNYRSTDGRFARTKKQSMQNADNALKQVLNKMNPLDFTNPEKSGSLIDDKREFLEYLGPEERDMALQSEKQYWYRRRQLNKLIAAKWDKVGGYYNRGKVIDPFEGIANFPASGDLFGRRFDRPVKYQESQVASLYK